MPKTMPLAAALAACLAVHAAAAPAAEPVKIRIGWIVAAVDSPLAMLGKQGIAKHEGQSYTLEFSHFTSTPAELTALAADQIDLAPIGFAALALGVENAKLEDLRVVADALQDGVGDTFSNSFFVLKDGPVKKVEDLKGKIVTANAIGSAIEIALRVMLKKHGLEDKRDYTFIESQFPTMKAELIDRKVDMISLVPPFAFDPALAKVARRLFTQKDAMGTGQLLVLTGRQGFLQKNRAAVVDFLEDNLRFIRWYFDPAHHAEAIASVATYIKVPPAILDGWMFTPKDSYRDPDGKPNLEALKRNIASVHDLGYIPAALDPAKYTDLSLVAEAAKRLH